MSDEIKKRKRKRKLSEERREQLRANIVNVRKHIPDNPVLNDPKKQDFLRRYYSPDSDTYANGYQSALAAGYSESYARVIINPSGNHKWVNIANYMDGSNMTPQHIIKSAERIALRGSKESEKLKALEFLAKINGMMVEKKITATVNIDQLLNDDDRSKSNPNILDL